ncbi:hypothetical protein BGY98DRAFT_914973 [Russula aff. rugulosa BPL654]|nr:hypothetical protein BGY98DRAFT_914973 [Russula aff. rugulosa BPL654]
MSEKQQRLILSIIDFLSHSINDGIIREKDRGDLDVAIRRIGGAFGLDPTDQEQMGRLSVKPATLEDIFEGFFKTKDKICSTAQVLPSTSSGLVCVPSAEDKATADKYKREGNALLISKQYDKAIHAYTEAIKLNPSNPVYYSNRAVAHSGKREHLMATVDAEKAIELDPKYTKGYSRLGQAQYSIGNYAAAAHAYRRGLELEPNNVAMQAGLLNCDAQTMNVVSGITTPAVASTGGSGRFADMERGCWRYSQLTCLT